MDDTLHLETEFEQYITRKLKGLSDSGEWMVSDNDVGYDREHAIYFPDFVEFQRRLDPDKLEKMQERLGSTFELNVVKRLVASLEANGTVQTLRKGFPYAGFQTITCCALRVKTPSAPYPASSATAGSVCSAREPDCILTVNCRM